MNGVEDDGFEIAVKQAASMVFAGTQADELSPVVAHSSLSSAATESVRTALCCCCPQ